MSLVTKSITEPGIYSSGWPVRPSVQWRRTVAEAHRHTRSRGKGKSDD
jgi:UDP-3-O-[3-hydroxymyristoyl] glucosamine N-acyltransferase